MVDKEGVEWKTVGDDRMKPGHYAEATRVMLRRIRHFDLLVVCLRLAYGSHLQGRPYPMDN